MKVFLDTNIVIDFLAKREDFFQDNSDVIISRDEKGFIDFKNILIMNPSVFLDKCK